MSEEQKLEILKEKLELKKKLAYDSTTDNMLQNFYNAMSLNSIYEAITGKNIFLLQTFAKDKPNEVICDLIEQINDRQNKIIIEEKKEVKKELYLNNNILTNASNKLNEYYNKLKKQRNVGDNYNKYYLPRLLTPLPDRNISEEETRELINEFIKQEEPEYKDIYDEMNSDGRIFLLNGPINSSIDYGGGCNGANYDYNSTEDYVVVKNYKNDLAKLCTIAHELAHTIELLKLRKTLNEEDYLIYRLTSQYGEIYPITMELKCQNFLEENTLYKDEIQSIRTRALLRHKLFVERMINNVYGNTSYLETYNHDLEYANAMIGGIYLSNNDRELIKKFDCEKINSFGLEIFDKIGCNSNEFDKALTKQLKKCM